MRARLRSIVGATDSVPIPFGFTSVFNAPLNTEITSNMIFLSGLSGGRASVPISISGGSYSEGANPMTTSPGLTHNTASVQVRLTSSASNNTAVVCTLTVGGVAGTFTVTTLPTGGGSDTTPNAFPFSNESDAALSTVYTSLPVLITGIDTPADISISGGSGTYSIDGAGFTSSPGTGAIQNGQQVRVRVTSSASNSTAVSTTLTVGGVSHTYTVTTLASGASTDSYATLPRDTVTTTMPTDFSSNNGTSFTVTGTGGSSNLQTLINNAFNADGAGNHEIIVPIASYTFTSGITIPAKSGANSAGTGWVVIRSANTSSLTAGTRVGPGSTANMPTLTSTVTNEAVINTANGAHHCRFVGLNATMNAEQEGALINLGDTSETVLANQASFMIIDRCYIHGQNSRSNQRRAIALHSASTAIIDSYISNWYSSGEDSQAIHGQNGPGPYLIHNNYLEGAGENLMFGGGDQQITNLLPSDVTITKNHFFKPAGWKSLYSCKNILELKGCKYVLIEGNVFDGSPLDSQDGFAIVFTSVNQDGGAPWSTVQDITFRYNIVRNAAAGLNMSRNNSNDGLPATSGARYSIHDNLFYNIGSYDGTVNGIMLQMLKGIANVDFTDNTMIHNNTSRMFLLFDNLESPASTGFKLVDNIMTMALYGILGSGIGQGSTALNSFTPSATVTGNVFIGDLGGVTYPGGNTNPASLAEAVVNPTTYAASVGAAGKGADLTTIDTKTNGVVTAGVSSMP